MTTKSQFCDAQDRLKCRFCTSTEVYLSEMCDICYEKYHSYEWEWENTAQEVEDA